MSALRIKQFCAATLAWWRVAIAVGLSLAVALVAWAQTAHPTPAEASAILQRFVGAWRTETTVRDGEGVVIATTSGSAAGESTLGGRFVEFRSASDPPGESDMEVMTWDPVARVYRQWLFDASGYWHEATGTYDDARATITWRGEKDGTTFVIEDRWVSPERLEWTLRRTARDGRVEQTIEGVLTR